jgi:hypothetical protein
MIRYPTDASFNFEEYVDSSVQIISSVLVLTLRHILAADNIILMTRMVKNNQG